MSKDLTPEQRALLALHDRLAALEAEVRALRRLDPHAMFRSFAAPDTSLRFMSGGLVGSLTDSN